ncbi:MAG: transposase [Ideonella sp. MAG2]|nr:MAG: transposase [Ideonella sp. MAG2]
MRAEAAHRGGKVAATPASANHSPALLYITPGSTVVHNDREYLVLRVVDLNLVLAREPASDQKVLLKIGTLDPPAHSTAPESNSQEVDLESVPIEDWEEAEHRLEAIRPLLGKRSTRTKEDYAAAAQKTAVSTATLYRWVDVYRQTGLLSSLLPERRSGGRRKSRLNPEVQLILDNYVKTKHLTQQKPSAAKSAKEIRRLCSNAKLSPLPAVSTIRRQIDWIDGEEKLAKREGQKAARERFSIHKGSIPDANWPLAMVQIDHTLLAVIIVDDEYRKPINRAWITLAIDVFSRVCLGMYLSLDAPSAMSAGMCVSHAILPKEGWMARVGCPDIEWPTYGVMDVLHMDNAKEFRGNMLKLVSKEYGIDLHLRKVKVPHYGAHIERLMGTVTEDLKSVKGATFSGPREKGTYDAEGNASMTFDELEKWLVLFFARYHNDIHTGIGTTPLTKWKEGIFGTKNKPGRGLPPRHTNVEKLRIDFMPYVERTIQDYGVVVDEVHYFHDVLRPWANLMDEEYKTKGRQYRFRYDPRDISQFYFFEPNAGRYFPIPFRDSTLTPCSLWELQAARKAVAKAGMSTYDERLVFSFINRQREIEEQAAEKTKAARRAQQKRMQHEKARKETKKSLPIAATPTPTTPPEVLIRGYDPSTITAIDDDD